MECITCKNDNCIINKNHRLPEMQEYIWRKSSFTCKKGQNVIIEGSPVHGLFFLKEGIVKISKNGFNGKEQIIKIAKAGEAVGHRGFASGESYKINAEAISPSRICSFSNKDLMEMFMKVPQLVYDLMVLYAEELDKSETKVKKLAQMTVREKVIDTILYVHRKFGQEDKLLNLQLSRKEIADFAGTTEEQVIRVISNLKSEKLLYAEGKKIGVSDVQLLKREIADHNYFIDS